MIIMYAVNSGANIIKYNIKMRNFILSICVILFYQLSNSQELKREMISSQGNSVTSLDQRIYLPRSTVITLSQDASSVMLANGSSGNKTQNKIISTDDKPINVFRSSSTSYMGAGTFHYNGAYSSFSTNSGSNWQWNYGCGPTGSMTGWPFLYHACGNASGAHIMFNQSTSAGRNWNTGQWYSAWIR